MLMHMFNTYDVSKQQMSKTGMATSDDILNTERSPFPSPPGEEIHAESPCGGKGSRGRCIKEARQQQSGELPDCKVC